MEQNITGVFQPSLLNFRFDEGRQAPPDVPLTGRAPCRAETSSIAPLAVIRWISAAVRLWRWRARSQQELRELSDRMLKDIGLRREDVGYSFPKPFWQRD